MTKKYEIYVNDEMTLVMEADRFILSQEQGVYIFLRDIAGEGGKETVGIVKADSVIGVLLEDSE